MRVMACLVFSEGESMSENHLWKVSLGSLVNGQFPELKNTRVYDLSFEKTSSPFMGREYDLILFKRSYGRYELCLDDGLHIALLANLNEDSPFMDSVSSLGVVFAIERSFGMNFSGSDYGKIAESILLPAAWELAMVSKFCIYGEDEGIFDFSSVDPCVIYRFGFSSSEEDAVSFCESLREFSRRYDISVFPRIKGRGVAAVFNERSGEICLRNYSFGKYISFRGNVSYIQSFSTGHCCPLPEVESSSEEE